MKIVNGWKIEDEVSGLVIEAIEGEILDTLRITKLHIGGGLVTNREFSFTKDGRFNGAASELPSPPLKPQTGKD